ARGDLHRVALRGLGDAAPGGGAGLAVADFDGGGADGRGLRRGHEVSAAPHGLRVLAGAAVTAALHPGGQFGGGRGRRGRGDGVLLLAVLDARDVEGGG